MHSEKCLIFQMGRYGCNWLNPNTLLCIFVLKIQNGAYTFTSHPSKKKKSYNENKTNNNYTKKCSTDNEEPINKIFKEFF